MRISRLRYQPIEGGTLSGHFALHVTLGSSSNAASEFVSLDSTEIATKIHDAFETLSLKPTVDKGILIDAREADDLDSSEMISLLGTLRDWKYFIGAWVSEHKRCAWFEYINHLVVFIESQNEV